MKDESLHTIPIVKAMLSKYGPECVDWEPAVIQKSLYDDFKAAKINVYKALAGLAVLQNDRFWQDWQTFHLLCQAFNNIHPSASTIQELSVSQMMVAVDIATSLRKNLGSLSYVPVYTEEVAKFIASQALNQGVWFLPEPLEFASSYASKTVLVCKDCGNEEYIGEEEEHICPICTGKYDSTRLGSFVPDQSRIKRGFGTNVEITTKYDTLPVQRVLQTLVQSKDISLDADNPDHICAAKLYTSIKYFLKRRNEAKQHVRVIGT